MAAHPGRDGPQQFSGSGSGHPILLGLSSCPQTSILSIILVTSEGDTGVPPSWGLGCIPTSLVPREGQGPAQKSVSFSPWGSFSTAELAPYPLDSPPCWTTCSLPVPSRVRLRSPRSLGDATRPSFLRAAAQRKACEVAHCSIQGPCQRSSWPRA